MAIIKNIVKCVRTFVRKPNQSKTTYRKDVSAICCMYSTVVPNVCITAVTITATLASSYLFEKKEETPLTNGNFSTAAELFQSSWYYPHKLTIVSNS